MLTYSLSSVIYVEEEYMYTIENKEDLLKLGSTIRELRLSKGYSQESFADFVGLHRTYMGGIERGERNISFINLILIARKLELDLNSLFKD